MSRLSLLGALAVTLGCSAEPVVATPAPAPQETPSAPIAADEGRRIFLTGVSPRGTKIEAVLAGGVVADATTMPCAGCHGEDGRGRPEGGMKPSNITWEALSKPYGGRGEDRRVHVAYDARALRKAIALGVDPSGNELLPAMPRYRMSHDDMASLAAHVQTLGQHSAVGIDDDSIAVATVLPSDSPAAATVEAVLGAYFVEVNARGGVFGRRLELEVLRLPAGGEDPLERLQSFFADRPRFAVVAPHFGAADQVLTRWLADAAIPVVGPASNFPDASTPPERSIFYIDGGIPAQALALAEFAAGLAPSPSTRAVVVVPDRPPERALGRAVAETWTRAGLAAHVLTVTTGAPARPTARVSDELVLLSPGIVLMLGPAEIGLELITRVAGDGRLAAPPIVLLPGSLSIGDPFGLPANLAGRLFAAYSWTPDDLRPAALGDYEALVAEHRLPPVQRPIQLATLTAAKVFVEGLTRAGRRVTRESLIDALERLSEYPTGLTPEVTFGPNRRVGLGDVRIVAIDGETGQLRRVDAADREQ